MGSIFFPLIVAPFRWGFLNIETFSTIQKLIFDNTDSNILRVYVHLFLICVTKFETVFCSLIFWQFLFLPPIAPNKSTH